MTFKRAEDFKKHSSLLINAVREGFKALGTDLAGELIIMWLNFFLKLFNFSSMPVLVWHTNRGVHSRRKDLTVTFSHCFSISEPLGIKIWNLLVLRISKLLEKGIYYCYPLPHNYINCVYSQMTIKFTQYLC